jgi:hypothetical protein
MVERPVTGMSEGSQRRDSAKDAGDRHSVYNGGQYDHYILQLNLIA